MIFSDYGVGLLHEVYNLKFVRSSIIVNSDQSDR